MNRWATRGVDAEMKNPLSSVIEQFVDRTITVYECRHCGTNLSDEQATCSCCGSEEVAVYEFRAGS